MNTPKTLRRIRALDRLKTYDLIPVPESMISVPSVEFRIQHNKRVDEERKVLRDRISKAGMSHFIKGEF